ncbi:glycoside hydrolase family 65 protein [Actinoallomurus rhizosphaericola]|uniref:glycoside hydrolase family 65 protein n=1 Tax=Actinoallomurus rhizosphaericola TaxID=2952536 RepID=UPI002091E34A|nr:glycoside hydrolase family 65 protein [Actinoallomurus rhizosphaericola]MCO5992099.1 glycoside hydrolase family 65 protein [Actinoallomurus rhizosphaericola]
MIRQAAYTVEPWCVREQSLDLDTLAQSESVFALSNGHIGLRGNLEEGEPHGLPGTYLNSVFELRPLPYAEAGYGYPESGQTVINITNGKVIRLLVEDEPFDVRYGELRSHERVLDFRAGTLTREVEWKSPAGDSVRVRTVRLVSLVQRGVAAIHYEVEAVDRPVRIVVQSELVANESLPDLGKDPRVAGRLENPLVGEESVADKDTAVLVHRTRHSGLRVAAAMGHEIDGPECTITSDSFEDVCRYTIATRLQPGQRLRLVKYLAYGWSSQRSRPAVHDQVIAALAAAKMTGWDGLVREQRAFLDDFWAGADVEVEGDAEVQQAVRFGLFHTLQAGARAERRPIPAKGLTGPGYDGHTFWDTETFVLPLLTYTRPEAAADALRWRHATIDLAKERAELLGLRGTAFPWRTIAGQECSGYWPAGTAAFHINADIADAVIRYTDATADEDFSRDVGLDLLVETARLWRSLGHHNAKGRFRIDGVTGPDEYSAIADNNVYTNLMAQRNLRAAADLAEDYPEQARRMGVTEEETADWRDAANAVVIPYDKRLEVHPQSEGFTHHARWDFENTPPDHYPLLLHYPYFDIYRKQVVKQADLVLALHLRGDAFTDDEKLRDFVYYEGLTVRDSSLSACTQAVMAAETGHLELAHDYIGEAALMDLRDLEHNTRDGLHIASLAGTWTALVAGLGGMRQYTARLTFAPRLPPGISRLAFRMRFRGRRLKVTIGHDEVVYELLGGEPLEIDHYGEPVRLDGGAVRVGVPPLPSRPSPAQPPGREPARRDKTVARGPRAE